jgi:putative RNA 2'-phosphotransferase
MDKRYTHISKFLSFVLRHRPQEIGITLDPQGWVGIDDLLVACSAHGHKISRGNFNYVVAYNNKKRFAISENGKRVRASQEHSVEIDLGYQPAIPPELLYHGRASKNLPSIRRQGLTKGKRHHVHLSLDLTTARAVGKRHGSPVVLTIRADEMVQAGFIFYKSSNAVWLTEMVPYEFIVEPI